MRNRIVLVTLLTAFLAFESRAETGSASLSSFYRFHYDSVLGSTHEIFFDGHYSYTDDLSIETGFSTAFRTLPERYFLRLNLNNYPRFLQYSVSFLGREFPHFGIRENSIYPTVKVITRIVDIEAGLGLRFLSGLPESFTVSTLYNIKIKFFDRDNFKLSYTLKNFDHFYSANITALSHNVDSLIMINDFCGLLIGIGADNPGQVGMTSFFSSFYGNLGVRLIYD